MDENTKKPKVSILMAVYKENLLHLKKSICSILGQDYKNFEFIIIDDSGEDNPLSRELKKYAKKDDRIRLFKNKKNLGLTKSLNKALKLSMGCYIARMDADDISIKRRISKQTEFLDKNKDCLLVGSRAKIIDESDKIIGSYKLPTQYKQIRNKMMLHSQFIHPAVMFRRGLLKKIGEYDERYRQSQDYDFFLRATAVGKCNNLPEDLLLYRRQKDQITNKKWFAGKKLALKIRLRAIKLGFYKPTDLMYLLVSFCLLFISPDIILKIFYKNE